VFARAGKTDHPFRFILSQTSAGNAVRCAIDRSSFKPFLCSCLAAVFFVPRMQTRRAQGAVNGWPSR